MLIDWIQWISSFRPEELVVLLGGLIFLDGTRYAFSVLIMLLWDLVLGIRRALFPRPAPAPYHPSVCALLVGYNEADSVGSTLESIWGTYPGLEIVVVDDGSTDGMAQVARSFADTHAGVTVVRREKRGGKSSGMNFGFSLTQAEVVVAIDCDSYLGPDALEQMVQPMRDPRVGATGGTVVVRDPHQSILVMMQAFEYLRSIFLGRMLTSRLGILGIVSGAFGAFRREALQRTQGWDVGPPEDLDLVLALRKCGYRIVHVPYAFCFTKTPTTLRRLLKQRIRWDDSGVIRNHCRKHVDMAWPFSAHFRLSNLILILESWVTSIFTLIGMWVWLAITLATHPEALLNVGLTLYFGYLACEAINALVILAYSPERRRDAITCLVVPIAPVYMAMLVCQRTVSLFREAVFRTSFKDNFVPKHVRDVTWRW